MDLSLATEPSISLLQVLLGVLALAAALGVVLSKSAVSSALSLMATLFLTAFLYLAQGAFFAGVVQILIYAGAIAVLFVFIVMLLDLKESRVQVPGANAVRGLGALAVLVFVATTTVIFIPNLVEVIPAQEENLLALSARSVSLNFVSTYMLPFQITGMLILAAILGVVMLAKSVQRKGGSV